MAIVGEETPMNEGPSRTVPPEIGVLAAAELLRCGEPGSPFLLDCRTPDEHAIAAIGGATLIPMHELPARLSEIERYRGTTIIVHCHHGVRSLRVASWLRERGFPAVTSMAGGIDAWSLRVDPRVPRY